MTIATLTYRSAGAGVHVDLDRLIASRMLIQANSGGGKSRAIRQLLEETHGRVQHLVIDPEGEFPTLRERFDYVLAAKQGGDVLASPKTAKLLCRRLVELGASAVLDLYELSLDDRRAFVRYFLTELMGLPRALWHPIVVVIDEMHVFAPEAGQSQAAEAVTALATQGRKRGFCLVGATQRISKLHKDVAAELLNKMIGRTGLDIDLKRAGDELGMGKDERAELKSLAPGEFYVYGPAISNEVQIVRTGDVVTSHPEAGKVGTAPPPPPAKVKAMLAQLVDLPKEAEEEARSIEDLKRQNAELSRKLRQAERGAAVIEKPVVDQDEVRRLAMRAFGAMAAAKAKEDAAAVRAGRSAITLLEKSASAIVTDVVPGLRQMLGALTEAKPEDFAPKSSNGNGHSERKRSYVPSPIPAARVTQRSIPRASVGDIALGKGERIVLTAIAQYPDGADREQLTVLTGYKRSSRDTYIQRLQASGLIQVGSDGIFATEAGMASLGLDFESLPTGEALRQYWLDRLGGGEREILRLLIEADGEAVPRDDLGEAIGYKRSSRDTYLQRLAARKLVEVVGPGEVRASPMLFEERR